MRNTGYSQPPLALVCTHPFGKCTQAATVMIGTRAKETWRVYGSWSAPLAVLAIVPTVVLGAMAGVWWSGGDNNLFTQIALVVLVGLATKNAILIVEFARRLQEEGADAREAVIEAARLRLRPILMTSLAFVVGVLPLVFATGAGAEMRQAVGVAVFAGMLTVTVTGLLFTPLFYLWTQRARAGAKAQSPATTLV